ncbi:spermine synthase [Aphanothece hegewaldii CCALA 016]|uniref:Spermine synthase n=1 Tax=Aphanothece hegewaldii CCALA 016 TaxID=2107694 RepID=A0A2T1M3B0_9CHRO|nr:fused MFS/spermidine synthase [Aphanothece hegewaldii]PSF39240.1 spermine synthase [Aphanothece hegewaldii CCALA 016]
MMLPLSILYFITGFTALLYQVVWQRMLGLFSGSDVRSVTIVIASYLLGLGIGSLIGGFMSDRLNHRQAIQLYGFCNLGIGIFAIFSRFLFYDLLFLQFQSLAQSTAIILLVVFISLLFPTILMGFSLPLISKAISRQAHQAAPRISLFYGINTLGSGLGALLSGWYIIGTIGYEKTIYFGAILSILVGFLALIFAFKFESHQSLQNLKFPLNSLRSSLVIQWCVFVFLSGFAAISLEIIWFRLLDTILQSISYTYAHLLAFILIGNAIGSIIGSSCIRLIRHPRSFFFILMGSVIIYSVMSIWLVSIYWQSHPTDLQVDIGYIDPQKIDTTLFFKYLVLPFIILVPPSFFLGFYFPLVQKAVQTDDQQIGQRVGLIQVANILGNTTGSLVTGLWFLDILGTAGSLRFLLVLGLVFLLLSSFKLRSLKYFGLVILILITVFFPNNTHLWSALHGIPREQYFIAREDATGVAGVTEANGKGTLLASGQAQAGFPYMIVHGLLGSIPALIHPHPSRIMIIGLGSGGTAHTAGVNPLTRQIQVIELLGAELKVLDEYAKTPIGRPLHFLFNDYRYEFIVGDGRQELAKTDQQFDIIEADAIYPWRSRAGMLYSSEFFNEVLSHLAPGGIFVEWNVGWGTTQTFQSVFPYVIQLTMNENLSVLIGSVHEVYFNREALLTKLADPDVIEFLNNAGVEVEQIRHNVKTAKVEYYSQSKNGKPSPINTDLFPRSEYYLNQPF